MSDSHLNWESGYSDLEQTTETEEETDSSLGSEVEESSWVIIDQPNSQAPLESTEPQDQTTDQTTSETQESTGKGGSSNTLQVPLDPSKRNASPGRDYLMKPGFHKRVQIQELPLTDEIEETTKEASPVKLVVPGLEMSQIKDEPMPRKPNRGTLSPRKSDSPRRGDASSKRKTLALSGSSKRRSWSDPDIALKKSIRSTKSADYPTDELRKSRNRLSEESDETTPRRKLVTSGKYTKKPEKPFWEELDESVDFQKQSQDSFSLLKDQGFGT